MKKNLFFALIMICALLLPSCYATRTYVGTYREDLKVEKAGKYKFAKAKQAYLFWGLIPLGRTTVDTPDHGSCEIKTRWGFGDAFLTLITGGIFSMQTIKVSAPRMSKPEQPQQVQYIYSQPASPAQSQVQPQSDAELDAMRQMLQ